MIFKDRVEAGRLLAEELTGRVGKDGLILAIPRGGVVVGAEAAKTLGLSLDLIIPRKIGSPQNPEVAIGAVTQDGTVIYDQRLMELLQISEADLEDSVNCEVKEIERRMAMYGAGGHYPDIVGRQLVVVDDGVATGHTMFAALRSIKKYRPAELILAVPVAPPDTLEKLNKEVDRAVCLLAPEHFYAVGQFYQSFEQTADAEVINIMERLKGIKE